VTAGVKDVCEVVFRATGRGFGSGTPSAVCKLSVFQTIRQPTVIRPDVLRLDVLMHGILLLGRLVPSVLVVEVIMADCRADAGACRVNI
jgi:hypothetical protein